MIDDDEEDFIITRDIVREIDARKYSVDWVPSFEEGIKRINRKNYDVYLVDYRMGAHTGDELIREALKNGCEEPLILLTGQNDKEADNNALLAGASDYLVKGSLTPRSLETALRYGMAHCNQLKKINQLNAELESRVKDRTIVLELTNAELNSSREKLEDSLLKEKELNDLKSRFVSLASHEFRTPLATILSSLSLIARYNEMEDYEKQKKHIERIKTSVGNLTDIINDVLSLSKLEEGGVSVSTEKVNIRETVEDIAREMQSIAKPEQKIEYAHSGDENIMSDKKILKHILFNLLSNAIKFAPEGKSIRIASKTTPESIEVSVADSGIGISAADQKHLFERFFRAGNANNIQGTGLGLNIVGKYVELLGGTITCNSILDEGTTFTVLLPKK